jgi:hypothetical protein
MASLLHLLGSYVPGAALPYIPCLEGQGFYGAFDNVCLENDDKANLGRLPSKRGSNELS